MSNVEFETDSQGIQYAYGGANQAPAKGLTGLLIKMGLAKNENGAKMVMIGIFILNIIITVFLLMYFVF